MRMMRPCLPGWARPSICRRTRSQRDSLLGIPDIATAHAILIETPELVATRFNPDIKAR